MDLLLIFILYIFGLGIGSFLNVLVWRLNDEKAPKFWQGRSICPKCKHVLAWFDNVPLLSFVLLGGKCRNCGKKISFQYPLVELLTGVATVIAWDYFLKVSPTAAWNFQFSIFNFQFISLLVVVYSFIVIFVSDWIYGLIPDEMVISGSVASLIYNLQFTIFNEISNLGPYLLTGIFSGLGFLAIVVATKFRGMGLGDVKLAFLMGLLLGFPKAIVAFWSAFILGGFYAVVLMLLKRKKISDTIPLGPFLVIGTLISALWYIQLLKIVGIGF